MDPMVRLWLYESWCRDLQEKNEFARDYSILIGSFTNSEMARQMIKRENPDFESSPEDFEKSTQMVLADREKQTAEEKKKRRRRLVKKE